MPPPAPASACVILSLWRAAAAAATFFCSSTLAWDMVMAKESPGGISATESECEEQQRFRSGDAGESTLDGIRTEINPAGRGVARDKTGTRRRRAEKEKGGRSHSSLGVEARMIRLWGRMRIMATWADAGPRLMPYTSNNTYNTHSPAQDCSRKAVCTGNSSLCWWSLHP